MAKAHDEVVSCYAHYKVDGPCPCCGRITLYLLDEAGEQQAALSIFADEWLTCMEQIKEKRRELMNLVIKSLT